MTVIGAIIEWLKGFNSEGWKMSKIDTDIQGPKIDTFSLVKEPTQIVKRYISGKAIYTDHYMVQARLASNEDIDRAENHGFGEALEEYVRTRSKAGDYPEIPGAVVKSVDITTPFYLGSTNNNSSVYQMTIAIKYEKEN